MKNIFEKELPNGYVVAKTIDATNKKLGLLLNILALIIGAIIVAVSYIIIKPTNYPESYNNWVMIGFVVAIFVYIILHELVHGIAYKLLTKEKLTFGLTFSVAFCGVPKIYVYRKTALIALCAPLIVFTIIWGVLLFVVPNPWIKFYVAILMGLHIGGCIGDIYNIILYTFKFKDKSVLMQDTGPKQTFYVKEETLTKEENAQ